MVHIAKRFVTYNLDFEFTIYRPHDGILQPILSSGLLKLSLLLTLTMEATLEDMEVMVWDTGGSMVPAPTALVWAIEATEATEDTTTDNMSSPGDC